jgi:DNA-binding ferritin-like protein
MAGTLRRDRRTRTRTWNRSRRPSANGRRECSAGAAQAGEIRTEAVISTLIEALDDTITRARERMEQSAEYDAVTEDLMIATVAVLEKQRWMLAAHR